ncbi:ABC transporter ATP-binding protein [Quadrisphaera oryzae]|uniref:ABC transporter ATP-binding protein n=1 Tax=Quadrisphaera TaxID=317661 RepID=UPI001C949282
MLAVTGPAQPVGGGLFRAVRGRVLVVVTLSVVGALASVVPLVGIVELTRALWPATSGGAVDAGRAWAAAVGAALALVVAVAANLGAVLLAHLADSDLQLDLRRRIVQHLRALPLGWFDARSSGAVRKVAQNDVSAIHQLTAHALQDAVTTVVVPVVVLAYLFAVEWRMALACLALVLVALVLFAGVMRGSAEKYAQYDASLADLNAASVEYVHGIAVVRAFGQAGRSHRRFGEVATRFAAFYGQWSRETAGLMALLEVLTSPVVVLAVLGAVGTWLVTSGAASPLDVLPALLLGATVAAPLLTLGFSGQFLRSAVQARASLLAFLSTPVVPQPEAPVAADGHDVEVTDLSFSYEGEHEVLRDVALRCPAGTVTALVGASGSGKSTLARLLLRFYDPTAGAVVLGGADIRQLAPADLYRSVAFVLQDVQLLRTSIRDNIRLARPHADEEAVERAARLAHVHDRIQRLPRGYDSVVGEDAHLSGGEAQRLTIARALLADAPVLVLDEATAFADPDSEAAVQDALSSLAAGRTVVVIAHRLHTVVGADQLVVLDRGRVIEHGTHSELAVAGGLYQQMWERYAAEAPAPAPLAGPGVAR